MIKTCTACHRELHIDQFVICKRNKDGHGAKCKECHSKVCLNYITNNYEKRLDSSRSYYKRNKKAHNERTYKWQAENHQAAKEIKKRFRQNNAEKIRNYRREYGAEIDKALRSKYPERYKARNKVNNAIAAGNIPKASTFKCIRCGNVAEEYHHHNGYSKQSWLDIVPVCRPCHAVIK